MAEKTKKSNEGSRRSPARKPAAKRPAARKDDDLDAPAAKKKAAKPKKPAAARKFRNKKSTAKKSAAKSARRSTGKDAKSAPKTEEKPANLADSKETQAERRIAGGPNAEVPAPSANENQPTPVGSSEPPPATKRTKPESRVRPGESADCGPRPNTLVPTNGIHTTKRRIKPGLHQNRGVMALIAATLLGILILGEQTTPPDMSDFEQQIAASQDTDPLPETTPADPVFEIVEPRLDHRAASQGVGADRFPRAGAWELDDSELAEMERLLARLDLGPSAADGIVDQRTETAIRLYQEFAGLPVNGAPSRALLADMREVADILDNGG